MACGDDRPYAALLSVLVPLLPRFCHLKVRAAGPLVSLRHANDQQGDYMFC
jgi:hypothetical protein